MFDVLAATANQPIHWTDLGLKPGIDLGLFTLRFYPLAYIAGLILGWWQLSKMVKAPGAPMAQRHVEDLFFYCTLGIIFGGRLGYALFYTGGDTGKPSLFTHFTPGETVSWDLLRTWDGGMSFHGGLIGVLVAITWVSWRNRLSFIRVCDYIACVYPIGHTLGRIANFVNGELWGRPVHGSLPWAMVFPGDPLQLPRHPSQLYEALLEGVLLTAIMLPLFWKTRARFRPGLLVGVFTAGMGMARFVVEFFREPDAQLESFAHQTGLSMGQWLSIPLIVAGLGLVIWAMRRQPLGSRVAETTVAKRLPITEG
jgi:phosphatidylglycerol:prolipoprotein diacylglycerol transferase